MPHNSDPNYKFKPRFWSALTFWLSLPHYSFRDFLSRKELVINKIEKAYKVKFFFNHEALLVEYYNNEIICETLLPIEEQNIISSSIEMQNLNIQNSFEKYQTNNKTYLKNFSTVSPTLSYLVITCLLILIFINLPFYLFAPHSSLCNFDCQEIYGSYFRSKILILNILFLGVILGAYFYKKARGSAFEGRFIRTIQVEAILLIIMHLAFILNYSDSLVDKYFYAKVDVFQQVYSGHLNPLDGINKIHEIDNEKLNETD